MPIQFPSGFIASLRGLSGFDEDAFIEAHHRENAPVSVRLNPGKNWNSRNKFHQLEAVPWCTDAFYLPERPSFTSDPLFHAGAYYVQEASSMFLQHVLKQVEAEEPGKYLLDLCAAPGGKSTLIQGLIHESSLLVSNEIIKTRVGILQENLIKWGAMNSIVTQNDPKDFGRLEGWFDYLIVDAPCSGSGLFRKDPDAMSHWSEPQVEHCSLRQKRILEDSISCLKEDGYLVYSTCSYSFIEDEAIMKWLVEQGFESIKISFPAEWGIVETKEKNNWGYRFYPDKLNGEGFFIAVFQNRNPGSTSSLRKKSAEWISKKQQLELKSFIENMDDFSVFSHNDLLVAFHPDHKDFLEALMSGLYIKQAGTAIGMLSRKDFIPEHALAMSQVLKPVADFVELNLEQALQFLRRADLTLQEKPGWSLMKYEGLALGWAKILPNRLNNYYPKDWRILNK